MGTQIQAQDGEGVKPRKKDERPRYLTISIVERQDKSVIIQHETRRYFAPADKLKGNEITAADLERCTLYGEDWRTWVDELHGDDFATQLYNEGIYTKADFRAMSGSVRAVLQRIYVNPVLDKMLKRTAGK